VSPAAILADLASRGVTVRGLCADSRLVTPGDVFVAMPGRHADGRRFAMQAVARGAAAVLHEAGVHLDLPVPTLAVAGLAAHAGEIADLAYGRPSGRLWMAGITGTNGKTSVSQWLAQAMNLFECPCAVIGTLGNGFPGRLAESPNTTPDAVTVHRLLAGFVDQGAVACAMEVSSIGLDQHRVAGVDFDVAVLTNLTRDHLEYHGDMATYAAAKERLFRQPNLRTAVINLDDPFGERLAADLDGRLRVVGYTLEGRKGAEWTLAARDLVMDGAGFAFTLDGVRCRAPLVGRFNASNLLAVIGALLASDETIEDVAAVLPHLAPPPGRMQALGGEGRPTVVVDYAHTPDALEKALSALREMAAARGGRLVCLFGCGGERDPGKRPQMGGVAERLADRVWVSSDNPRGESAAAIADDILGGMTSRPEVELDRAEAIRRAVAEAAPEDVVLLAGKGHEPYQEISGSRLPFDDLAQARRALESYR
jgi:UDP-N-acetylmuramoyl-L-alanyl-D-glutamate--2,6-diaminopimelate ligase